MTFTVTRFADYQIVEGTDAADLQARVRGCLSSGWQPLGGPLLLPVGGPALRLAQAMVRPAAPYRAGADT